MTYVSPLNGWKVWKVPELMIISLLLIRNFKPTTTDFRGTTYDVLTFLKAKKSFTENYWDDADSCQWKSSEKSQHCKRYVGVYKCAGEAEHDRQNIRDQKHGFSPIPGNSTGSTFSHNNLQRPQRDFTNVKVQSCFLSVVLTKELSQLLFLVHDKLNNGITNASPV